jgi:hypothetical protein
MGIPIRITSCATEPNPANSAVRFVPRTHFVSTERTSCDRVRNELNGTLGKIPGTVVTAPNDQKTGLRNEPDGTLGKMASRPRDAGADRDETNPMGLWDQSPHGVPPRRRTDGPPLAGPIGQSGIKGEAFSPNEANPVVFMI